MSDTERTPRGTARVNSERFDTELAAVWYAANYYYEASYRRQRGYFGVVFRGGNTFGITVRSYGPKEHANVTPDVPDGTIPIAIWHTHLPAAMSSEYPAVNLLYKLVLKELFGETLEHMFSDKDLNTQALWTLKFGRPIPIYLLTARVIKRYRGPNKERTWVKDPPSGMRDLKGLP